MDGEVVDKTCEDGTLKYNQHHNISEDVQNLMEQGLTKKLVATTVSGREKGMMRREEQVTSSSHKEKTRKNRRTIEICGSSKGGGRQYLRHVGGDVPECLRIRGEAASEKEKERCSSSMGRQVRKTTTRSLKEKDEDTEQQQKTQSRSEGGGTKTTQTCGRRCTSMLEDRK